MTDGLSVVSGRVGWPLFGGSLAADMAVAGSFMQGWGCGFGDPPGNCETFKNEHPYSHMPHTHGRT